MRTSHSGYVALQARTEVRRSITVAGAASEWRIDKALAGTDFPFNFLPGGARKHLMQTESYQVSRGRSIVPVGPVLGGSAPSCARIKSTR